MLLVLSWFISRMEALVFLLMKAMTMLGLEVYHRTRVEATRFDMPL
tara:strand:+ start:399 stop:536 length:138 start_codon:yes stop_codon:yes gene_type:complete